MPTKQSKNAVSKVKLRTSVYYILILKTKISAPEEKKPLGQHNSVVFKTIFKKVLSKEKKLIDTARVR